MAALHAVLSPQKQQSKCCNQTAVLIGGPALNPRLQLGCSILDKALPIAGLHMALKDSEAAVRVMQSAVEAKRLALGPSHPAVTESVLGLAAIFRASGRNQDAMDVIEKEMQHLTQEGLQASPGELSHS